MPRILHTADWQIGKPYRWISDPQKQARLQRERVEVVSRIGDVARSESVDAVLVAGDLFDSSTVPASEVLEVMELIGALPCPVLVIPGNHDHGGAGGIWRREDLLRRMRERAPNLELLTQPEPTSRAGLTLLPCPLLRRHDNVGPMRWIEQLNWQNLDSEAPRVLLAHGSVQGFGSGVDVNALNLEQLPPGEVDYIALGDWHGLMQVQSNAWYSGTPEPDRFPAGPEDQRSQVILADLMRGDDPRVQTITTGRVSWHRITMQLQGLPDLERLNQELDACIGSRAGRDLLRLELNGRLGLDAHRRLQAMVDELSEQLLHLRLRGELRRHPIDGELDHCLNRSDGPLLSSIAAGLKQELEGDGDPLIEQALIELHQLCVDSPCA